MMSSCIRMLLRRLCLRRGICTTGLILFFIGLFGVYFMYFGIDGDAVVLSPDRVITVPTAVLQLQRNHTLNHSREQQQGFVFPTQQPGVQLALRLMSKDTPECSFSTAQPEKGQFDVQMPALLNSLAFDNPDGGVWKQGFELTYSMNSFSSERPLQVIIMPHSHNDPGWIKTFEDYYRRQTRNILNLMTDSLTRDGRKRFVWAEISYLDLWWNEQNEVKKEQFKKLVSNGQLEIVTGGWVMNDEASTHYFSMLDQLIEGHLWMQENLPGVTPQSSWANDPFGYSPTMAYLLKGCGLNSMLIQRAHYSVKKELAQKKQLEFRWIQEWDKTRDTAILCHLMPFYSYDVPHTCGPDPKICCQFDFHRLPGSKVSCPWKIRPQAISPSNVKDRAEMLADQYRKKATLFKTNVLLIPLGDDFRYDTQKEINAQFDNYFKLMDYMNSHPEMKINVKFGTLSEYFNAVRGSSKDITFPSLAGDFFTYSDRDNDYWSGYFVSRPFHKHMERVLAHSLRMAEIFYSLAVAKGVSLDPSLHPREKLTGARRNLGLFQHHDGITGTAKDHVVVDYAQRIISAITQSNDITQASLKALLVGDYSSISTMAFIPEETYPNVKVLPTHAAVDIKNKGKQVVSFVNSLAHNRVQLVSVTVNSPDVMVMDASNVTIQSQINPLFKDGAISKELFQLVFIASMPALGVAHYLIATATTDHDRAVKAVVQYVNVSPQKSNIFETKQFPSSNFVLSTNLNISAKFSGESGLLKSVAMGPSAVNVDMEFVSYGTRPGKERSGAYLFLPDKTASSILPPGKKVAVTITAGPLLQEVTSDLGLMKHSVLLSNSPGHDGRSLKIHNLLDISSESNREVAMRIRSSIDNPNGTFYTDLNGFQLIQRRYYQKLPIQGNFYPMPTTAILQDYNNRLTLLSGQPLGVASLEKGWLEVILDRRLMQDDHRGLGQGVKDTVLTFEPFVLLIERRLNKASSTANLVYPSLLAQHSLDSLLHPPAAFISSAPSLLPPPYSFMQQQFPCDTFLLNLRSVFQSGTRVTESALILHRRGFDCGFDMNPLICNVNNGEIKLGDIFRDVTISEAMETSLSLLHDGNQLNLLSDLSSHISEMQIKTYRLSW